MHRQRSSLPAKKATACKPLPAAQQQWITDLHTTLWQRCIDPQTRRPWERPVRVITKAELRKLVQLIQTHQLPCTLKPDFVDPSMILCVHGHPAIAGEPAPQLTRIAMDHLGLLGQRPKYAHVYQLARKTFYPLVKTAENLRRLKTYGLPSPEEC